MTVNHNIDLWTTTEGNCADKLKCWRQTANWNLLFKLVSRTTVIFIYLFIYLFQQVHLQVLSAKSKSVTSDCYRITLTLYFGGKSDSRHCWNRVYLISPNRTTCTRLEMQHSEGCVYANQVAPFWYLFWHEIALTFLLIQTTTWCGASCALICLHRQLDFRFPPSAYLPAIPKAVFSDWFFLHWSSLLGTVTQ